MQNVGISSSGIYPESSQTHKQTSHHELNHHLAEQKNIPTKESSHHRCIQDVVQPLSTLRLRPIRQKTKNAVANILSSGEVCLEFISKKRGKEKIQDVMRITGDGQRVVVYNLGKEEGLITDTPAPIPAG